MPATWTNWFEVTDAGVATNRYAYAANDPINLSDPNGNFIPAIVAAAVFAYKAASAADAVNTAANTRRDYAEEKISGGEAVSSTATEVVVGLTLGKGGKELAKRFKNRLFGRGKNAKATKEGSVTSVDAQKTDAYGNPFPDGGFSADLSKSNAKSRSGQRNAGNKQLNDAMAKDPDFRRDMEARHGNDVFDRTSTSGSGRRNPEGTEWDHNSQEKYRLDLRTKANHDAKTRNEGRAGGGRKKFW